LEDISNKRFDEACKKIDEMIRIYGDIDQLWFLKGIVLVDLGKFNDAVESFEKAIKLGYEEEYLLVHYYGYALLQTKRFDMAEKMFRKAIKFEDNPDIRALLLLSLLGQNKIEEACKELKYIQKKWPNFSGIEFLEKDLENLCY